MSFMAGAASRHTWLQGKQPLPLTQGMRPPALRVISELEFGGKSSPIPFHWRLEGLRGVSPVSPHHLLRPRLPARPPRIVHVLSVIFPPLHIQPGFCLSQVMEGQGWDGCQDAGPKHDPTLPRLAASSRLGLYCPGTPFGSGSREQTARAG